MFRLIIAWTGPRSAAIVGLQVGAPSVITTTALWPGSGEGSGSAGTAGRAAGPMLPSAWAAPEEVRTSGSFNARAMAGMAA